MVHTKEDHVVRLLWHQRPDGRVGPTPGFTLPGNVLPGFPCGGSHTLFEKDVMHRRARWVHTSDALLCTAE